MDAMPRPARTFFALAVAALLGACAQAPTAGGVNDPYETANRKRFASAQKVDTAIIRPASIGYGRALPAPVVTGVSNFSTNFGAPGDFVNGILQGNLEDAFHNAFRFALNTSIGVGGLFDPASSFGLEARETDFGETLHVWGAPEGAFLWLPLVGPSTERDLVGRIVDTATNPLGYVIPTPERYAGTAANIGDRLGQRFRFRTSVDDTLYNSADPYAQARSLYLQNRRFELGQGDDDFFDPYEDLYAE